MTIPPYDPSTENRYPDESHLPGPHMAIDRVTGVQIVGIVGTVSVVQAVKLQSWARDDKGELTCTSAGYVVPTKDDIEIDFEYRADERDKRTYIDIEGNWIESDDVVLVTMDTYIRVRAEMQLRDE